MKMNLQAMILILPCRRCAPLLFLFLLIEIFFCWFSFIEMMIQLIVGVSILTLRDFCFLTDRWWMVIGVDCFDYPIFISFSFFLSYILYRISIDTCLRNDLLDEDTTITNVQLDTMSLRIVENMCYYLMWQDQISIVYYYLFWYRL